MSDVVSVLQHDQVFSCKYGTPGWFQIRRPRAIEPADLVEIVDIFASQLVAYTKSILYCIYYLLKYDTIIILFTLFPLKEK